MRTAEAHRWQSQTPPIQLIKMVRGLAGEPAYVGFTLVAERPGLECLDAPSLLPAGSTVRVETHLVDVTMFEPRERIAHREPQTC